MAVPGSSILSDPFVEKVLLVIVGAVTGALTSALVNRFFNRATRRQAAKDRAELQALRRRGEAPFFRTATSTVTKVMTGPFEWFWCSPGHPEWKQVLDGGRAEIKPDLKLGAPVLMLVENAGSETREVKVEPNEHEISLDCEPDVEESSGHWWLAYPYAPEKRGEEQSFIVSFETDTGVQGKHAYVLKHGFRELRRVDPA